MKDKMRMKMGLQDRSTERASTSARCRDPLEQTSCMELVLTSFTWLCWQAPVHRGDDRVANRAFLHPLELDLCVALEQAQRVKDQSVLTCDELLDGKKP